MFELETKPSAWLVPKLLDFKGATKVHFTRAEGNNSTDEELKDLIGGTVIFHAETVFLNDGGEYVEDKHGVRHYPIPLYKRA